MRQTPDIKQTLAPIVAFFSKYHLTMFIVVVTASLATAVILLNAIINQGSSGTGVTPNLTSGSVDEETSQRLMQLQTSDAVTNTYVTPGGRTNPFNE